MKKEKIFRRKTGSGNSSNELMPLEFFKNGKSIKKMEVYKKNFCEEIKKQFFKIAPDSVIYNNFQTLKFTGDWERAIIEKPRKKNVLTKKNNYRDSIFAFNGVVLPEQKSKN